MTIKVTSYKELTWDRPCPRPWKWLTFSDLEDIVTMGKRGGIAPDSFVYFHPEDATDPKHLRADVVLIHTEDTDE